MASTAAAPAAQSIPLICSICPKTSKFSDVSHLLTHIASKGHLSNMFKLDIAKATEVDAQRRLDEYQAWFDRYNIRGLLQTRSENRIQKNSGGRGRSASRGGSQSVSLRGGGNSSMVSRNKTGRNDVTRDKRVSLHLCGCCVLCQPMRARSNWIVGAAPCRQFLDGNLRNGSHQVQPAGWSSPCLELLGFSERQCSATMAAWPQRPAMASLAQLERCLLWTWFSTGSGVWNRHAHQRRGSGRRQQCS